MRRILTAALGAFLSFFLFGCNTHENAPVQSSSLSEGTTDSRTETTPAPILPIRSADVEKNILEKTFSGQDGAVLIEASMELPTLISESPSPVVEKINAYFKAQSDEWFTKLGSEVLDTVKADKEADPELFVVYTTELSFEVTYNQDGFLSILQFEYINAGGAHPTSLRQSHTFDLDDGNELGLENLLNGTPEEIQSMVADGFREMITENPENYNRGAKKTVAETPPDGFYLSADALVFYYQTDVIAPYAVGYPQFSIPYSDSAKFQGVLVPEAVQPPKQ